MSLCRTLGRAFLCVVVMTILGGTGLRLFGQVPPPIDSGEPDKPPAARAVDDDKAADPPAAAPAPAEPEDAPDAPAHDAIDAADQEQTKTFSFWSTIQSGGIIGYIIMLLSIVSLGMAIEHALSIRRNRLLPPATIQRLQEDLEQENYDEAQQQCDDDESLVARVVGAGLRQRGGVLGYIGMQTAMQEAGEGQTARLYRKTELMSLIGSIAPMLGLLGTVVGMIEAFNTIAMTRGFARPDQLAGGISTALVTTCMGLVVAIPTMCAVSYFRNKIDSLVSEAETVVEGLMARFRQSGGAAF